MKTASALFTANDKQTIATSIAEAEKSTAAEIVPIVATVSGRYDRAEDIFGVLCAIAGLCLAWMTLPLQSESSWSYFSLNELSLPLAPLLLSSVLSSVPPWQQDFPRYVYLLFRAVKCLKK